MSCSARLFWHKNAANSKNFVSYGRRSAYGLRLFSDSTLPGISTVLDRRPRILSRMLPSSSSDNLCCSTFSSRTGEFLSAFELKHRQKWQQSDSWQSTSELLLILSLRQPKTCQTSSSNNELLLLYRRSSGKYSGQSSLANLTISVMSCVELMTDGTNEFIIDEYNECFRFDKSTFARSHRKVQWEESVIDCRMCGTCKIFKKYRRFHCVSWSGLETSWSLYL